MFQHIVQDGEPIEMSSTPGASGGRDEGEGEQEGENKQEEGEQMQKRQLTEDDVRECVQARWSGTVAYRSLIQSERLAEKWRSRCKEGEGEHRLMRWPMIVGVVFPVLGF